MLTGDVDALQRFTSRLSNHGVNADLVLSQRSQTIQQHGARRAVHHQLKDRQDVLETYMFLYFGGVFPIYSFLINI